MSSSGSTGWGPSRRRRISRWCYETWVIHIPDRLFKVVKNLICSRRPISNRGSITVADLFFIGNNFDLQTPQERRLSTNLNFPSTHDPTRLVRGEGIITALEETRPSRRVKQIRILGATAASSFYRNHDKRVHALFFNIYECDIQYRAKQRITVLFCQGIVPILKFTLNRTFGVGAQLASNIQRDPHLRFEKGYIHRAGLRCHLEEDQVHIFQPR
jgi:hypothetical protein